ncbi:LysR substrate-binding domain-containing protein [uncultured Endozoicomonas sp.]|uniref:LysR substrate-binding domain-containing protein n=1 Tax=uncultured Endozoicomonas sp. TaxID=432652 RepID=UPI00262B325C|nr:LysR substrate-binding domain-containing protein [uncultured Endozoicomonas sp.]
MHITLRQLEIFKAVAQSGRVTIAAEKLFISQPAASMALAELEKHLGSLFDRTQGAGLKLNDSGRALLPRACELLDRAKELETEYNVTGAYSSGALILNASSTIGNNVMPRIINRYQEANPNINIELSIENTRVIEQRLLDFSIDMGIVEGTCIHPDIDVTTWMADELVIICHPKHALTGSKAVTMTDLSQEKWILREPGSGTRELFDEMIAPAIALPRVGMVLNRAEAIKQAVMDGVGIACISKIAAQSSLDAGQVTLIDVAGLNLKRHFYLLTHKKRYKSNVLNRLCGFLLEDPLVVSQPTKVALEASNSTRTR